MLTVAVLVGVYWANTPSPSLFAVWVLFYVAAMGGAAALRLWHGHEAERLPARRWITLHALSSGLLAAAAGFSAWFALSIPGGEFPLVHTILLSVIVMVLAMSTGFDPLNFSSVIPWVLVPSMQLYWHTPGGDRVKLALVCTFVGVLVCLSAWRYCTNYQRMMKAHADQQRMAALLAQQMQTSERSGAARSQSFATASRDLREPLHAIGLLAGSLIDTQSTPEQRARIAGHIEQRVETLNRLFDQLLDLAQIESAGTAVTRAHFRLAELFAHIDLSYRTLAAAKGLKLRIAPTDTVIFDDPRFLERILQNLVSDAIRHTDTGGIWIGFRRAGQREGGYIEVRDSGAGFTPREQALIRNGMNRETGAKRDDFPQLGLATVRRLVGLLGGELRMRSAPGRGTTIRFPVRAGDVRLAVTGMRGASGTVVVGTSNVTNVLLAGKGDCITDECANRLGWVLRRVQDAEEALHLIEKGALFDAVLCEYELKLERRDLQTLRSMRDAFSRRAGPRATVLLIVSHGALPEAGEASAQEAFPMLCKPVTPVRLLRTLAALRH
jgi:signal transduction histidine kinase/CheY-like chemotaxis protein